MYKSIIATLAISATNAVKLANYDCTTYSASDVSVSFIGTDVATVSWTAPSTSESAIESYTVSMLDHEFPCDASPCTIDVSSLDVAHDAKVVASVLPVWEKDFVIPFPVVASAPADVCVPGASAQALTEALKAKDEQGANDAFDGCPMDLTTAPLKSGFYRGASALHLAVQLGFLTTV